MRLGWSILCRDYTENDDGSLHLEKVFANSNLDISASPPSPTQVTFNPAIILISYWFAESDLDRRRYPALLRIVAPEDNQILDEWHFSIDFLLADFRMMVFRVGELTFVGDGRYEFHVEVLEYGEWNILSRTSLNVRNAAE